MIIVRTHNSTFGPFLNRETAEALVSHLALAQINTGGAGDILIEEAADREAADRDGPLPMGATLSATEPHAVHVHLHQERTIGHSCANTVPIGAEAERAWKERTAP